MDITDHVSSRVGDATVSISLVAERIVDLVVVCEIIERAPLLR
jgi:hypothetical protein